MERIVERLGALDVHKATVMACVRVWDGRKLEEHVAEFKTTVHDLLALRVLVDTVGDCYNALGVVHNLWRRRFLWHARRRPRVPRGPAFGGPYCGHD